MAEKSRTNTYKQPSNQPSITAGPLAMHSSSEGNSLPQAATDSRHSADLEAMYDGIDAPGCTGLKASQFKLISKNATNIVEWTQSRLPVICKQAGGRRTAAYLEVAERHQQQLDSYMSLFASAVATCEELVTKMVGLCPPAFAVKLRQLLRTGNDLGRLDDDETDAAWHALGEHLQMLTDEAKRSLPSGEMSQVVLCVREEMDTVKQVAAHVHRSNDALNFLKECIAKPAANDVKARTAKLPENAVSPEEFESSSRRSDAAAAALLEEAEAEKAAIEQKQKLPARAAKASKKSKKSKPQHSSPSNKCDYPVAGTHQAPSPTLDTNACSTKLAWTLSVVHCHWPVCWQLGSEVKRSIWCLTFFWDGSQVNEHWQHAKQMCRWTWGSICRAHLECSVLSVCVLHPSCHSVLQGVRMV